MAVWSGSAGRVLLGGLATAALLATGAAAPAKANGIQCGDVITASVSLDRDLICEKGITIGANNVRLDLGGHRIEGGLAGEGLIEIHGFNNVIISNGEVWAEGRGIDIARARNVLIEGVRLTSDYAPVGIYIADSGNVTVQGNVARGGSHGILLVRSDGNVLRGNSALGYFDTGIVLRESSRNTLEDNSIARSAYGWGLRIDGSRNFVTHNRITYNDNGGAYVAGDRNVLVGNTVNENGRSADWAGGAPGIVVAEESTRTVVEGNVLFDQGWGPYGHGIDVRSADTLIKENESYNNSGWGILAEAGARDGGGNTAYGNTLGQCFNVRCHE